MFRNLNGWEPIVILVVVLLLFGSRRLPDLARSIGSSAREFRKGLSGDDGDEGDAAATSTDEPRSTTSGDADGGAQGSPPSPGS